MGDDNDEVSVEYGGYMTPSDPPKIALPPKGMLRMVYGHGYVDVSMEKVQNGYNLSIIASDLFDQEEIDYPPTTS